MTKVLVSTPRFIISVRTDRLILESEKLDKILFRISLAIEIGHSHFKTWIVLFFYVVFPGQGPSAGIDKSISRIFTVLKIFLFSFQLEQ